MSIWVDQRSDGAADREANTLDPGERDMARIIWRWPIEDGEGAAGRGLTAGLGSVAAY